MHRARDDQPSLVENANAAGNASGEWQLVLNQEDRHSCFTQADDDLAYLVDDVGLDTFGRLLQNQQRRVDHQKNAGVRHIAEFIVDMGGHKPRRLTEPR